MTIKIDPTSLSIHTETLSKRKTQYASAHHERSVSFQLRLTADSWDEGSKFYCDTARDEIIRLLKVRCAPHIEAVVPFTVWTSKPDYKGGQLSAKLSADKYYSMTSVTFALLASKKSEILSEEDALAKLKVDELGPEVIEICQLGVKHAEEKRADDNARKRRWHFATQVLQAAADDVRERAKLAVRYEQRLAALRAEYEAEKQVQVAVSLRQLDEDPPTCADGSALDKRCIEAAKAKLADYVKGGESMFGGRSAQDTISEEDVA